MSCQMRPARLAGLASFPSTFEWRSTRLSMGVGQAHILFETSEPLGGERWSWALVVLSPENYGPQFWQIERCWFLFVKFGICTDVPCNTITGLLPKWDCHQINNHLTISWMGMWVERDRKESDLMDPFFTCMWVLEEEYVFFLLRKSS